MRRSRGVLLPPVRRPGRLRRGDFYRALRTAVIEGVFVPGDRLPSTREAAADYGVSRGLMEEVFAQLTDEGFFDRMVGRGTFVSSHLQGLPNIQRTSTPVRHTSLGPSRRGLFLARNAACREPEKPVPFNAGIADTSTFPWKTWGRLHARAMRELGTSGLSMADPRGLPELRAAIARHLAQFRDIRCTPGQVIIFNSAQQALNAAAALLLNRGDQVWLEDPAYLGARAAFELAGARQIPVPVDEAGLVVERGVERGGRARLAYLTPAHQYPTGVTLSMERRIQLLQWARHNRSWIIEDDYDGEFRYSGQPLASLHSLDTSRRVLYLGTLNKSMFVSLRLAYMVVPEELVEAMANIRTQMDGFSPVLIQIAMTLFMEEGHFSSHLRRMRSVYATKRNSLAEGLVPAKSLGWTWSSNPAGMHLLIRHRSGVYVRSVVQSSRLDLALLSRYRVARVAEDGLFLRFGALDSSTLVTSVEELLTVLKKMANRRT
jgi:GntR family transcriptional regulator/MocR family aminotransferase